MALVLKIFPVTDPDGFKWAIFDNGKASDVAFAKDEEQSSAGALAAFYKFVDELQDVKGRDLVNDYENSGGTG